MKKLINIYIYLSFTFLLISCVNQNEYVEKIPSDSEFVIQFNPKKIAEKGNFDEFKKYPILDSVLTEFKNKNTDLKELVNELEKSPTNSGADIISPIYIFGKKYNQKLIATIAINMKNKTNFEEQLKTILKSISNQIIIFETANNYTSYKHSNQLLIAWNKHHIFIITTQKNTSDNQIKNYFNELVSNKNSLRQTNNSFADFLSKTEDINIWYTGQFLNYFTNKHSKNENGLEFKKSSWATYLLFNKDNINFTQKFHPDPQTKVKLERRPMWKSKINTDFYKYFPARSYANFSFAVYPHNTRYIFDHQNFITQFLKDYNLEVKSLNNSAEGEVLMSIFDFEQAKSFDVNKYFKKKENYSKTKIIPQFILAARMKNRIFYDDFIKKQQDRIIDDGLYKTFKFSTNQSLFIAYKNNILYITNNHSQINKFVLNRVDKFNFVQSEYSNRARNSMFAYANLNLDDYPIDVKNYYLEKLPFNKNNKVEEFYNQFSKFQYNVTDEYTKNGSITLKNSEKNTLEVILEFISQTCLRNLN